MQRTVGLPAFSFERTEYLYADVVLASLLWGSWQQLESRAIAAGAAERAGEEVREQSLREAVVAFRRGRRLLSGEDLREWLRARALSFDELKSHVRRTLLADRHERSRHDGAPTAGAPIADAPSAGARAVDADLIATIRADAICSGLLRSGCERLAQAAAAHSLVTGPAADDAANAGARSPIAITPASGLSKLGPGELARRSVAVRVIDASRRGFADEACAEEDLARYIAAHHADWQRFGWQEATFAIEPAAREALMCIREDGMTLAEIATAAQAHSVSRSGRLTELDGDIRTILLATEIGAVSGPHASVNGFRLVHVTDRRAPDVADAECRELARSELVHESLARRLAGRVKWHGCL